MAVPFLISRAVVQLNVFTDTFWVSNLGEKAVSGMTSAVPMYTAVTSIGIGLATGIVTTAAFRIGQGNTGAAGSLAGNAIVLALVIPIACSMILFVAFDPIIDLMGARDVYTEARDYMMPFLLMSPVTVMNSLFGGMLRAEGAAKRSTLVQMSSVGINMLLDPVLIFGLGMGISGASAATVISYLFGVYIVARWYLKRKMIR